MHFANTCLRTCAVGIPKQYSSTWWYKSRTSFGFPLVWMSSEYSGVPLDLRVLHALRAPALRRDSVEGPRPDDEWDRDPSSGESTRARLSRITCGFSVASPVAA